MGKSCIACGGKGYVPKVDFMKATTIKAKCDICEGVGSIPEEKMPVEDGTIFFTQQCIVGYWQEIVKGKPIATLHVHVCPVVDSKGKPLSKKKHPENILSKDVVPRCFLQVMYMDTRPSYRRKGIMAGLLKKAMGDSKIEWLESSWDDSTAYGRNFLLSQGFKQEGKNLVYRKVEGEL